MQDVACRVQGSGYRVERRASKVDTRPGVLPRPGRFSWVKRAPAIDRQRQGTLRRNGMRWAPYTDVGEVRWAGLNPLSARQISR